MFSWDPKVNILVQQNTNFQFNSIGKYYNINLLILDNIENLENLYYIHLCQQLRYIFTVNNKLLHTLNTLNNFQFLAMLDLSGCSNLDFQALMLINSFHIIYLNVSNCSMLYQQLDSDLPQFFNKTVDQLIYIPELPQQNNCPCKYIYENQYQLDTIQTNENYRIRLFLIRTLPQITVLNHRLIGKNERELALRYFQTKENLQKEYIKFYLQQTLNIKYVDVKHDQHYFNYKQLFDHLSQYSYQHADFCKYCKELNCLEYVTQIQFPSLHKEELRSSVNPLNDPKYPSIAVLLLQIFYIIDLTKHFTVDLYEQQLNSKVLNNKIVHYLRYLPQTCQITPFIIAELLCVNHVLFQQQSISPQYFLNIAIALIKNDAFRFFFQYKLLIDLPYYEKSENKNNSIYKFLQFFNYNSNLTTLYKNIQVQIQLFLAKTKLDVTASLLDFNQVFSCSVYKAIEKEFYSQEKLTFNSLKYFGKIIEQKQKVLAEQVTSDYKSMFLTNIDIFVQMYNFGDDISQSTNTTIGVEQLSTNEVPKDVFTD